MNLPFSWFGAGVAASPRVLQAVGTAVQSTSQYFGDLLSSEPTTAANGPSVLEASQPQSDRPAKSLASLQKQLSDWLRKAARDQSLPIEKGAVSVELRATGQPHVEGPDPIRSQLQSYIAQDKELASELRKAYQSSSGGLDWLPGMSNGLPFRLHLPAD